MEKIILVLCLFLVAVKGQIKDLTTYTINPERSEEYNKQNRLQQLQAVESLDKLLENFKASFNGRLESMKVLHGLSASSITQMEERLNPLELLSDFSYQCVTKYRQTIPTVAYTTVSFNYCINQGTAELTNLVNAPLNQRNQMQNYFTTYYEAEVKKCGDKFTKTSGNYTSCLTTVTTNTNANIIAYQKNFANAMDTSECSANAYIKRAMECTSGVQSSTNSQIVQANVLINRCLEGKDECKPCPDTCAESKNLVVDYKNETILNPFYGEKSHKGCLLLILK